MGNLAVNEPRQKEKHAHKRNKYPLTEVRELSFIGSHFDPTYGVEWLYIKPDSPTKFTPELIKELKQKQANIRREVSSDIETGKKPRLNYHVFSSRIPGVFNLGGDLEFFQRKIKSGDREGLRIYARNCVDLVYTSASNFQLPITTISLIQGTAMGGGFEAALANNIIFAERQCSMGLPEILFNMFPGMGAYQLLSRRLPPQKAESLILSGRTFGSEELHEMGVIDFVVDKGEGEDAVWNYIKQIHKKSRGIHGLRQAIHAVNPFEYNDFVRFVDVWVDKVFQLDESDLKTMRLLVRAQQRAGF